MRFVLMLESQQGLSYADHVAIARRAEANGFEALFRSDHYQSFPGPTGRPTTDAWTVMAGLARDTERIGLGVLVSPMTFRHPGSFAKVVTTVDEMSGGRIEVGVGAGWHELEHRQLGLPFPPIKERADLMEDTLAILQGLWGEPDGWTLRRSPGLDPRRPVPSEAGRCPRPAADGRRRRPAAAARRRGRLAALAADGGALRRRVQPELLGPGPGPGGVRRRRRGVRGHRARPVDARPFDDGRRADRPRRGRDGRPAVDARRHGRLGRRRAGVARRAPRALDHRHARGGPRAGAPVRGGGRRAAHAPGRSCSRTCCRGTST